MMQTVGRTSERRRRIASDEAHAWARNLRLGNPFAKLVLSMLSLYVDGDGYSFVGINQLAEDCELSADTVRRRLDWLEDEAKVIRRTPQWIDESGMRNGNGRGRRTTDKILLLTGEAGQREAISPSPQPGSDQVWPSVSPRLALALLPGPNTLNHEPLRGDGVDARARASLW